jgi:hypothetical protein
LSGINNALWTLIYNAVLSRNPISQIGESLLKVKSLTKVSSPPQHNFTQVWLWLRLISFSWFQLSLANCQLQTIGSSLKSCVELKELRLAHNGIMVCVPLAGLSLLQAAFLKVKTFLQDTLM